MESASVRNRSSLSRRASSAARRAVKSWTTPMVRTGLPSPSRTRVAVTFTQTVWPSLRTYRLSFE